MQTTKKKSRSDFIRLCWAGTISIVDGHFGRMTMTPFGSLCSVYTGGVPIQLGANDLDQAREAFWTIASSIGFFYFSSSEGAVLLRMKASTSDRDLDIEKLIGHWRETPCTLPEQLEQAVAREDFELAAKLRDQINKKHQHHTKR